MTLDSRFRGNDWCFNTSTTEVVRVLLENGADISARDAEGRTALDEARQYGMNDKAAVLEAAQALKKKP